MNAHAAPNWLTDMEAAKKQAAKENKAILMDFTGSDWCGFRIKLKKAVFEKPEFQEFAKNNLVLMEVDFPQGKKLPKEVSEANEKLSKKFEVEGFPTIVVLDSSGKELGRMVGYEGDDAKEYVAKLDKLIAKGKK